jgi:DNA-binding CsgD family transcriptional regulator
MTATSLLTINPSRRTDCELTPYELRLLRLLVEGHTYKTAATELKVTTHTISFHLRHVYEKLQVHSKTEAVGKALRNGLMC